MFKKRDRVVLSNIPRCGYSFDRLGNVGTVTKVNVDTISITWDNITPPSPGSGWTYWLKYIILVDLEPQRKVMDDL